MLIYVCVCAKHTCVWYGINPIMSSVIWVSANQFVNEHIIKVQQPASMKSYGKYYSTRCHKRDGGAEDLFII